MAATSFQSSHINLYSPIHCIRRGRLKRNRSSRMRNLFSFLNTHSHFPPEFQYQGARKSLYSETVPYYSLIVINIVAALTQPIFYAFLLHPREYRYSTHTHVPTTQPKGWERKRGTFPERRLKRNGRENASASSSSPPLSSFPPIQLPARRRRQICEYPPSFFGERGGGDKKK